MTDPLFAYNNFGIKFLFDTADDRVIINFDTKNGFDIPQNTVRSSEVGGTDYQVPTGKECIILGAINMYAEFNNRLDMVKTTVADSSTGLVTLLSDIPNVNPTQWNAFMFKLVADDFLGFQEQNVSATMINHVGLQGIEYTPT